MSTSTSRLWREVLLVLRDVTRLLELFNVIQQSFTFNLLDLQHSDHCFSQRCERVFRPARDMHDQLDLVQQLYGIITNRGLIVWMFFNPILHSLVAVCAEDQYISLF